MQCLSIRNGLLILAFMLGINTAYAQKEYNRWYFQMAGHGFDFNTDPPTSILSDSIRPGSFSSGICDENGQLLIYTNGTTIWNRMERTMKGGIINFNEIVRTSYVLKMPGADSIYVIFTLSTAKPPLYKPYTLKYFTVDLRRDNGLGEVVHADAILMKDSCISHFVMGPHSNGRDYWIVAPVVRSSRVYSFLLTPAGINPNQKILATDIANNIQGGSSIELSSDGEIFHMGGELDSFFFFRFDNSTGLLYDKVAFKHASNNENFIVAQEFSPSSRYFYAVTRLDWDQLVSKVVQYDLSDWIADSIKNSWVVLDSGYSNFPYIDLYHHDLKLDPQRKKIYVSAKTRHGAYADADTLMIIIDNPDERGSLSNLRQVRDKYGQYPFFNHFPAILYLKPFNGLGPDVTACEGDSVFLSAGTAEGQYSWSTGDTIKKMWVKSSGTYILNAIIEGVSYADTVVVDFVPYPILSLGNDTVFCDTIDYIIQPTSNGVYHLWNTGDTTRNLGIHQAGNYILRVKNMALCESIDSITIGLAASPTLGLGKDSTFCLTDTFTIIPQTNGTQFLWNTGDTSHSINVNKASGKYILEVFNGNGCRNTDSISLEFGNPPIVYIGNDSTFCGLIDYTITPVSNGKYHLWNTGDTTKTLHINAEGIYSLLVKSNENCTDGDTIKIDRLDYPYGFAAKDTLVCTELILLDAKNPGMSYLWNTGDTSRVISVSHSGLYEVEINNGHCSITGAINVVMLPWDDCNPYAYIPNSFSPNGDGINDMFTIVGNKIDRVEMKIYDRWGACLYTGTSWNGIYKGSPLPSGVFMYHVSYTQEQAGYPKRIHTSGNVTLLR